MPLNIRFSLQGNPIKEIKENSDADLLKTVLSVNHVTINHTYYKIDRRVYDDDSNTLILVLINQ
jgi:hypothetical protein